MNRPVWEIVGMTQGDYVKLAWVKKKVLIRRAYGIHIEPVCGCGKPENVCREERRRASLAPQLRNHPYGLLLNVYFEHTAEDFRIHENYPHAELSCGHKNTGGVL